MRNLTNQQGDVLFFRIDELPPNAKCKTEKQRAVLKEGEHTGHAHVTEDEVTTYVDNYGNLYVEADKPFTVTHEEHHEQVIEAGIYEVQIVREYDYDEEEIRRVQD